MLIFPSHQNIKMIKLRFIFLSFLWSFREVTSVNQVPAVDLGADYVLLGIKCDDGDLISFMFMLILLLTLNLMLMLMLSVRECLKTVTCSRAVSESRQSSTEEVIIIFILKNTNFFLHSVLIVIIFIWKYYRLPMSCSKTLNNSRSRCSRPFCVWFCTYMLMVWDLKLMHAFIW